MSGALQAKNERLKSSSSSLRTSDWSASPTRENPPHIRHLFGQTEDRGLPLHHTRPQPGHRSCGRRKEFCCRRYPGLIEGAHLGKGLGIQFLRHIERTRSWCFSSKLQRGLQADYAVLLSELKGFNKDLLLKPRIVAITKSIS